MGVHSKNIFPPSEIIHIQYASKLKWNLSNKPNLNDAYVYVYVSMLVHMYV